MLAWISLLGGAGGDGTTPVVDTVKRRGASRPKYWWEQERFYLPPHKKIKALEDDLPHKAALEDAKQELAHARKLKTAGTAEITRLAGALGSITRSAKALERKIDQAKSVDEVAVQYRALGDRLTGYIDQLEDLRQQRLTRLRADDEKLLQLIMDDD